MFVAQAKLICSLSSEHKMFFLASCLSKFYPSFNTHFRFCLIYKAFLTISEIFFPSSLDSVAVLYMPYIHTYSSPLHDTTVVSVVSTSVDET